MKTGKYLYCIIKENKPRKFNIFGIEKNKVYTICGGKLSAVVSDFANEEPPMTRDNLIGHQKVIEEIMKKYDVLPISFGNIAESLEDIKEKMLKAKEKELFQAFEEIGGKVELSLKVFWQDMAQIFQEIANASPEISRAKKEAEKARLGRGKVLAIGELVGKELNRKRETEAKKILEPLKALAKDLEENKLLRDDMVLNNSFLVAKEREKDFDKVVANLEKEWSPRTKFSYVGPLPPFNFFRIQLSLRE